MADPTTREAIVANNFFPALDIAEQVTHADIILAPDNKNRYKSLALGEQLPRGITGEPRHWYALIPSDDHPAALTQVEFGMSASSFTGAPHTEARFDHELFVDEEIRINQENPLVKALFAHIGGTVVKAVRNSGDKVFASLEVQYALDGSSVLKWGQITYSKELLAAGHLLKQTMQQPYGGYPAPFRNAVLPKNRNKVASLLAFSALSAAREL